MKKRKIREKPNNDNRRLHFYFLYSLWKNLQSWTKHIGKFFSFWHSFRSPLVTQS